MKEKRFVKGFGWGVVATVAMSVLMLIGVATGMSPMPIPIPAAIISRLFGELPRPLLMLLAIISHPAYGGFWAGILASVTRRVTVWKGVGLGVFLWLTMQVIVLPFLGWGAFGSNLTLKIAGATLVLHLVYGATYGWLIDRKARPEGLEQHMARTA